MKKPFGSNAPTEMASPFRPGRDSDKVIAEKSDRERGLPALVASFLSPLFEGIAVLGAAFAVCVFLTWPLLLEFGDHIFGLGGDSTGGMAGFRQWADEIGYHITGVSHVASAGAPFGYDQGNGVNLQSAFVYFPAYLVTEAAGEIAAYNTVVLSGLVLSGAAMYWLVRWLGCTRLVAAWAGLVFIVFPWHLEKAQGHPSLAHLEGFPFLLLAVFAWYRKPDLRRAMLAALAAAVLWTTSGYFGFMGLAAVAPLFVLAAFFHARVVGVAQALRRVAVPVAASLAVPAVTYAIASRGSGEEGIATPRDVHELVFYGARPWEYLIPSYRNQLFGDAVDQWLVEHLHGSNFSETSLYVGWITIILAAGWLLWALVKRSRLSPELRFATLALAATVVTGLVFSLPTPLPRTDIPTPVRLIWEVAPQFRVPARFVALVMAGLVPLAALALDGIRLAVWKRVQPRAVAAAAAGSVCIVAGVLSYLELSITPPATVTDLGTPPPEYAAVRRAPRGLLAEYPLAPSDQAVNSDYLFWQRVHKRPIINGAPLGTFADAVSRTLVDPATPGTPEALAALGASVVVVRPSAYSFTGGPSAKTTIAAKGFRVLARTPDGTAVWLVTARPAPAIAAFASGFYPPETINPGSTMRWMGSTGTVELYTRRSGVQNARFSALSYGRPRRVRIEGQGRARVIDVPTGPANFSISLVLPRGRSSLALTTDPGAEGLPDGRQATVYMSNWRLERQRQTTREPDPLVPLRESAR
jgi:hypothetical protein